MNFPEELRYSKEHEWARVDGNVVAVGITDHAQKELGDIVFLEIAKKVGDVVRKGETFGTVESVKTLSDIYAPVSGKIVEINGPLADTPEAVNEEPYTKAWMVKIEMSNPAELGEMMSSNEYQALLQAEGH
jgi:glycine cleavage system H protein